MARPPISSGPHGLTAHRACQAHPSHQAGDRASADLDAPTVQLAPDLAHAIDHKVLSPHPLDLRHQGGAPLRLLAASRRIGPVRGVGMVGGWGDPQNPADRRDPVRLAVIVDECDRGLNRRSNSAIAKFADSLRRISLAWRSSQFFL